MTANIAWKSAEILKVYGSTLKQGTFIGGKSTNSGVITKDEPTNFTPNYIANIYENISSHIPLYIDHALGDRRPIGYAFKFGVSESLDDIKYTGFVFNQQARNKIMIEGYDYVSPEIEEVNGVPHLQGIAFVKNPAISGTDVSVETTVFSKPTNNTDSGDGNSMSDTVVSEAVVAAPAQTTMPDVTMPDVTTTSNNAAYRPYTAPAVDPIAELKAQMEEYKAKFEQQSVKTEQLLTGQYNTLLAEVKSLGVDDPSKIVHGLPTEQKIVVLAKLKDSLVKNKPMTQTSPVAMTENTEQNDNDKAFKEVIKELGLTEEQVKKLKGGS